MIGASDYVQAQRQRRRLIEDMADLYDRYDVLVTAGTYGPAPRLGGYQTIRYFWKNPAIPTPFNVTAGPAISICNGFSEEGLPLSMQVAGRPFDEAAVLRVADAFERATPWRRRRPILDPETRVPEIAETAQPPWTESDEDPVPADDIARMARNAGLTLTEGQFQQVLDAAPYVRARIRRLRRPRPYADEPASVFLPSPR